MELVRIRFGQDNNGRNTIHYAKRISRRYFPQNSGGTGSEKNEWDNCPTLIVGRDILAMTIDDVERAVPFCRNGKPSMFSLIIPCECERLLEIVEKKYDVHRHLRKAE